MNRTHAANHHGKRQESQSLSIFFIDSLSEMIENEIVSESRSERSREAGVTYALGAVARLTALSPHVLRAWERRYGAISPLRTAGGTRRYRESDVARLRLLAEATRAGHRIGDIARLSDAELRHRNAAGPEAEPRPQLQRILAAIDRLDADETERLLGLQLAALGSRGFVEAVVEPLLREVGERWAADRLCVASEHLASTSIRNLLGGALRRASHTSRNSPILFTTLGGERHELGVLSCAVIAVDLGANAIYLGPDLPVDEVVAATRATRAIAVAVSTSRCTPARQRERAVRQLRLGLPSDVALWLGGTGSGDIALPALVERIEAIGEFEQKVLLQGTRR
jgi:DNA-binding transcriptional MerR regulator/methylmalonyl-CoA mutase cobalamin-binding subunit